MRLILELLGTGLLAGFFGGALGIGGAIIIIPILVYLLGMDQKTAQGTTLLLMLPPIGLLAALEYLKRGQADWRAAAWIAAGFLFGAFAGAWAIGDASTLVLKRIFGGVLLLVGLKMLIRP